MCDIERVGDPLYSGRELVRPASTSQATPKARTNGRMNTNMNRGGMTSSSEWRSSARTVV